MTRGYQGKYRHLEPPKKAPKETSCDNKKPLTRQQADEIVRRARTQERRVMHWYQCEWCFKYHVTSK